MYGIEFRLRGQILPAPEMSEKGLRVYKPDNDKSPLFEYCIKIGAVPLKRGRGGGVSLTLLPIPNSEY